MPKLICKQVMFYSENDELIFMDKNKYWYEEVFGNPKIQA